MGEFRKKPPYLSRSCKVLEFGWFDIHPFRGSLELAESAQCFRGSCIGWVNCQGTLILLDRLLSLAGAVDFIQDSIASFALAPAATVALMVVIVLAGFDVVRTHRYHSEKLPELRRQVLDGDE